MRALLFVLLLPTLCLASDWKPVYNPRPDATYIQYDASSIRRSNSGRLVTAWLRTAGDDRDVVIRADIDCDAQTVNDRLMRPDTNGEYILKQFCKRWWEFWKP